MKLVSAHRILNYIQSDCLKKYIEFDTNKRKKMLAIDLKKFFLS